MGTMNRPSRDVLTAYLPRTLIDRWARHPEQPPVWGHWLIGSLMHCDITGFTAMSESLSRLGKEGAELMAGVLNGFFERMLEVADRWGGVQVKFGGDALLLFFSGREQAAHAAMCGLEMQTAMADFRRVSVGGQTYHLRMRIGIHSGRFFSASVGQPEGVLHYMLMGSDVNRTAEVEAAAQPGQVVASAETATLLGSRSRLTAAAGVWRLRGVEPLPTPRGQEQLSSAPSGELRRYLLPPIAARLAEGQMAEHPGEHRRVTALFINLLGASALLERGGKSEALAQMDAYTNMLLAALDRHGGFLSGSDAAEQGDKLIALFGAPLSQERDEASALRCALDLQRELEDSSLDLRQRIGINSGFVFAGEIGSARRREYTVIGDSVNLAARLMAAARPGQAMVSEPTAKRAGSEFELRRLRPIRVKGKGAPVQVYRLEDARLPPRPLETEIASPVLGRDAELASLLKLSRRAARGRGHWAYIWGGPGIGKSRLAAEVAARLRSRGWRQLTAFCQRHTARTPFAAWISPLRALFGIEAGDSPQDARRKLETEVARLRADLQAFAPLVAELLSLPPAEREPLLPSLDVKTRRQRLTAAIVELLHAAARERPMLLLFEDVHWADGPSLELLAELLSHLASPLIACLTSRQEAPPLELSASRPALSLHLPELLAEDARRLVASAADLADDEVKAIVGRAQGNPLFLQELARSGAVRPDDLPETINDVMMARLDRLPHEEKTVLRLASVIGPSFELRILRTLLPRPRELPELERVLADLTQRGLTRAEGVDPPAYRFSHVLTQEVAYETLPYAERRRLHRGVADHIERDRADQLESVCELLLHHYELANEPAKTVRYGAMSGDRAAAVFAWREAIDYYLRSLAVLERAQKGDGADRSLLLERLGDTQEMAGRYSEATETFAHSLKEWQEAGRRPRARLVPWSGRPAAREALLCRKAAVSCERRSDYDGSLRWLDRGQAVLPRKPGVVGAQVYVAKSMALFRKALYEEAIPWGRLGLALSRRSGDQRQLADAHRVLANSYIEKGALRQATRHLRPAVRLCHELGDLPGQAMTNSNLAACYQLLGILEGALYHYEIGLKADERVGNLSHAATVHNNIGEVLLTLGRLEEAVAHLEEVVRAHLTNSDLAAAAGLAQVNLCRCRLAQGDLDTAEEHIRRGLRILRRIGAQGLVTEARLQLAELRLAQGRAEEARQECRSALTRARALYAKLLEARAERLLSSAQAALGEPEAARSHVRASVALARRIGADYEEARSLIVLAGLAADAGRASRSLARQSVQRAAAIMSRMGATHDLDDASRLLARLEA